jgi:2-polyprenyl-3-methyl-5-hydroxy-6-metoxy-1,4-benzoquinol methylase
LLFRAPTDSPEESRAYYQVTYSSGFTTEMPSREALGTYVAKNFEGTPKDFRRYIALMKSFGAKPGDRVLDFGCSWGYGTWQLKEHGFNVTGFDVSNVRVAYAREKLHLRTTSELDEVENCFDFIFSAHVLEHVPSPKDSLRFACNHLAEGGMLVAITPNGSFHRRIRHPAAWRRAWGQKHPNLLDEVFYLKNLEGLPLLITTDLTDMGAIKEWKERPVRKIGPLDGHELLVACRVNSFIR